ncbi:NUDIX domain-containing protein [Methylobacterium mesophilicum]
MLRADLDHCGLPEGVPDEHRNVVACAVRETLEETRLRVSDLVPFGLASGPNHSGNRLPKWRGGLQVWHHYDAPVSSHRALATLRPGRSWQ